jgi:PKHD-type hydroxylase
MMSARTAQSFDPTTNPWVAMAFSRAAVFSAEECEAIIRLAEAERSGWAKTLDRPVSGSCPGLFRYSGLLVKGGRDRKLTRLLHKLQDLVISLNAQIWRYDISGRNECFVVRYDIGDQATQHCDVSDTFCDRKVLVLLQLSRSDAYKGGALEFGVPPTVAPRDQGSVVAFPAWVPHRVKPILSGRRYSAGCFVLGPSFR